MSNKLISLITVDCEDLNEIVFARSSYFGIHAGDKVEIGIAGKGKIFGTVRSAIPTLDGGDIYEWINGCFNICQVTALWQLVEL